VIGKLLLIGVLSVATCHAARDGNGILDTDWESKVGFDPDLIGDDGLYGPPNGRRALDYELCIPDAMSYRDQVAALDPSLRFSTSPGRIGCAGNELLAIGTSHQTGFRSVLESLAQLPYVRRIEQAWFE
jgi:hypothetical protein